MKKLKVLRLQFENQIEEFEIPAFRSAVALKADKDNILFHHHTTGNKLLYKYPLIQFKSINNHPAIICLEQGADEINKFLTLKEWQIKIGNRKMELIVLKLDLNQFNLQVWDKTFSYRINNWIALNQENYGIYPKLPSLVEKIRFLEKTLIAHILSFAQGVQWNVDKQIQLNIIEINKQRWVKYKGTGFLAFDLSFTTNVFLPDFIGLGKSAGVGFGAVRTIKRMHNYKNEFAEVTNNALTRK